MSIQSALNQLISTASGLASAGTYLYSQSDTYRAKKQIKAAEGLIGAYQKTKLPEEEKASYINEAKELAKEAGKTLPKEASSVWYAARRRQFDPILKEQARVRAEQAAITRQAREVATKREAKKQFQVRLQHLKGGKFDG